MPSVETQGADADLNTPYQFRVKPQQQSLVPFRTAYGSRAIPKLIEELNGKQPIQVRERAAALLAQMFHQSDHLYHAIREGVITVMKPLLLASVVQEFSTCKKSIMEMAKSLADHGRGRSALFQNDMIPLIVQKLSDQDPSIQEQAFDCLIRFSSGTIVPENRDTSIAQSDQEKEILITGAQAIMKHHITLISMLLDMLPNASLDSQAQIFKLLSLLLNTPTVHEVLPNSNEGNGEPYDEKKDLTRLHLKAMTLLLNDFLQTTSGYQLTTPALECLAVLFAQDRRIPITVPDLDVASAAAEEGQRTLDAATKDSPKRKGMTFDSAMFASMRKVAVKKGATKCLTAFVRIPKGMAGNMLVQKTIVQTAAMKALAILCVDVDAKKIMVKEGNVSSIQDALVRYVKARFPEDDKISARAAALRNLGAEQETQLDILLLHTSKAISALSEEYRARFSFQQSLPILQKIVEKSKDKDLLQGAQSAIKVITWRP